MKSKNGTLVTSAPTLEAFWPTLLKVGEQLSRPAAQTHTWV